uniref:Peptidase 1 n=1 Tax=Mycena chlorophos TaxID=658473 RepID=A0ABQ0L8G4_MYCCL|nr:peptidase 1 [Mycena chlorophos]
MSLLLSLLLLSPRPEPAPAHAAAPVAPAHQATTPQSGTSEPGSVIPNEFTIQLKPNVNRAAHLAWVEKLIEDVAARKETPQSQLMLVDSDIFVQLGVYGGIFGPTVIAEICKSADVSVVEPCMALELQSFVTTNDNSWDLERLNTGANKVPNVNDANKAELNRSFTTVENAGRGIKIYIIDSGVNDHPDIAGRLLRGVNLLDPGNPSHDTADEDGHGTRMACMAAGSQCGAAKAANIVPVKVTRRGGPGQMVDPIIIMEALAYVWRKVQKHREPAVVNMSIGLIRGTDGLMRKVLQSILANGVHLVISAGNRMLGPGPDPEILKQYNKLIADDDGPIVVGATDWNDRRAHFSNYGPRVTIWAPGSEVVAAAKPVGFACSSGTSEASALVSGVVATILGIPAYRRLTPAEMKAKLLQFAVPIAAGPARTDDGRNLPVDVDKMLIQGPIVQKDGSWVFR